MKNLKASVKKLDNYRVPLFIYSALFIVSIFDKTLGSGSLHFLDLLALSFGYFILNALQTMGLVIVGSNIPLYISIVIFGAIFQFIVVTFLAYYVTERVRLFETRKKLWFSVLFLVFWFISMLSTLSIFLLQKIFLY